jgi:hypothetical protein
MTMHDDEVNIPDDAHSNTKKNRALAAELTNYRRAIDKIELSDDGKKWLIFWKK